MSNGYKFYFQQYPDGDVNFSRKDLEQTFNCIYGRFENFAMKSAMKNSYTEDCVESNGSNIWLPSVNDRTFSSYECTLKLLFKKNSCDEDSERMFNHLCGRKIEWYDTFRKKYATLVMTKAPVVEDEVLYGGSKRQVVSFVFTNIDGRLYNVSRLKKRDLDIKIELKTDGTNLYLKIFDDFIPANAYVALMTCGSSRSRQGGQTRIGGTDKYVKSKYRWHIPKRDGNEQIKTVFDTEESNDGWLKLSLPPKDVYRHSYAQWTVREENGKKALRCRKAHHDYMLIPYRNGSTASVLFGVAMAVHGQRLSNVQYFRSNVEVIGSNIKKWYSVESNTIE